MKNSILSVVLALFLLMGTAYALGEVSINESSVYFSGNGKDIYTAKDDKVSAQGFITLNNNINTPVTIKFANTGLVLDSADTANITQQTVTLSALQKNVKRELKLSTIKKIEAGEYSTTNAGTKLQIVNSSNPSQIFDEVDVRVLVPSIEITAITVKDAGTDVTDTKLEKGQKFTVTVDYKNIADQTDLESLNVNVGVYDGADTKLTTLVTNLAGDDLEDNKDVSTLSNGRTGSASFDFEMPYDISDGNVLTVFAEITADSRDTSATFYARKIDSYSKHISLWSKQSKNHS
jgi:hypothetical protein